MDAYTLALTIYSHPLVRAIIWLLIGNVLAAIFISLYRKEFRLAAVGDWLLTRAIPYIGGGGIMQLVLMAVPAEWSGLAQATGSAVWMFVIASLLGKILATLADMGLPIPKSLTDKPKIDVTATP